MTEILPTLLEPIEEIDKPSMQGVRFADLEVPSNIQPILTLLGARAVAYEDSTGLIQWEITTADGRDYCRVEAALIGDHEELWTKMVGFLLDYAAKQRSAQSRE